MSIDRYQSISIDRFMIFRQAKHPNLSMNIDSFCLSTYQCALTLLRVLPGTCWELDGGIETMQPNLNATGIASPYLYECRCSSTPCTD